MHSSVLPTHVGVILLKVNGESMNKSTSHTRGGDPKLEWQVANGYRVLPTHVGVILQIDIFGKKLKSTSHTRGGDPSSY